MPKPLNLEGMRFGRLLVISRDGTRNGYSTWLCKCDCGNEKVIIGKYLKNGKTQSCGCIHKEQLARRSKTHGMSGKRLYRIWHDMKNRCEYAKDKKFSYYGGRGIKVCNEWSSDFKTFMEWSLENGYKENLTIDRINNDGNYEPSNCRWITMKEQCTNRRKRGFENGSK
jgi:hypothetical protein